MIFHILYLHTYVRRATKSTSWAKALLFVTYIYLHMTFEHPSNALRIHLNTPEDNQRRTKGAPKKSSMSFTIKELRDKCRAFIIAELKLLQLLER